MIESMITENVCATENANCDACVHCLECGIMNPVEAFLATQLLPTIKQFTKRREQPIVPLRHEHLNSRIVDGGNSRPQ